MRGKTNASILAAIGASLVLLGGCQHRPIDCTEEEALNAARAIMDRRGQDRNLNDHVEIVEYHPPFWKVRFDLRNDFPGVGGGVWVWLDERNCRYRDIAIFE